MSKSARSALMGRIRGRGNRTTEMILLEMLKHARVIGWRRHYRIVGKPDFAFPQLKIAIFVDGCFWHGCRLHFRAPKASGDFWAAKIAANRKRDARIGRELRSRGWMVVRIWEHNLRVKNRTKVSGRLRRLIELREGEQGNKR